MDKTTMIMMAVLVIHSSGLSISFQKTGLVIPENSYYMFHISVSRSNIQLLPSNIESSYSISNAQPFNGQVFDYFYYLQPADITCYQIVVQNNSFLFPCPFITSKSIVTIDNYAMNRVTNISRNNIIKNIPTNLLNNANFSFLIDNTRYPFPQGAYPTANLSLQTTVEIFIQLSDIYKVIGIRLAWINATVFLLFAVYIGKLVYDVRKMNQTMKGELAYNKDQIVEEGSDDSNVSSQQNYEDILMAPEFNKTSSAVHSSDNSMINSLITSKELYSVHSSQISHANDQEKSSQ